MASLPSLASVEDVQDRLGYVISDPKLVIKLQSQLDDASVVVRAYCNRDFTLSTVTQRFKPRGDKVVLLNNPVVAVTSVSSVVSFGPTEQVTPLSYWNWVAGPNVYIGDQSLVINGPDLALDDDNVWLEVAYTHGYATPPDDILTVVANLALRVFSLPGGGLFDLQTVGPYTTRYSSFTAGGPLTLSPGDREVLNKYRGSGVSTIELRS